MKAIIKTLDTGTRLNSIDNEVIEPHRPSVVTVTEFVKSLVTEGKLEPLGGPLKDTATDAEFEKFYSEADKNTDLAVDSFMSKFGVNASDDYDKDEAARLKREQELAEERERQEKAERFAAQEKAEAEAKAAATSTTGAAASAAAATEAPKQGAK